VGYEGAWRFDPVVNQPKIISGERGKSGWGHPTFFARKQRNRRMVRCFTRLEGKLENPSHEQGRTISG
jgi:hypothetical protein